MSARKTVPLPGTMPYELVETETRDAIKCNGRAVAYVALGAEAHAAILVAAPQMYRALSNFLKFADYHELRAAISAAGKI